MIGSERKKLRENECDKIPCSKRDSMIYIYIYIYIVQFNGDSNTVKSL